MRSLWKFNPSTNQWCWLRGSSVTRGTYSLGNRGVEVILFSMSILFNSSTSSGKLLIVWLMIWMIRATGMIHMHDLVPHSRRDLQHQAISSGCMGQSVHSTYIRIVRLFSLITCWTYGTNSGADTLTWGDDSPPRYMSTELWRYNVSCLSIIFLSFRLISLRLIRLEIINGHGNTNHLMMDHFHLSNEAHILLCTQGWWYSGCAWYEPCWCVWQCPSTGIFLIPLFCMQHTLLLLLLVYVVVVVCQLSR
jgi:hypothetical protein